MEQVKQVLLREGVVPPAGFGAVGVDDGFDDCESSTGGLVGMSHGGCHVGCEESVWGQVLDCIRVGLDCHFVAGEAVGMCHGGHAEFVRGADQGAVFFQGESVGFGDQFDVVGAVAEAVTDKGVGVEGTVDELVFWEVGDCAMSAVGAGSV